ELVSGIVRGDAPFLVGIPRVDDDVVQAAGITGRTDALGIGSQIDGFGKSVVEVELHSIHHAVPKGHLHGVVVGIGHGAPRIERAVLWTVICVLAGCGEIGNVGIVVIGDPVGIEIVKSQRIVEASAAEKIKGGNYWVGGRNQDRIATGVCAGATAQGVRALRLQSL